MRFIKKNPPNLLFFSIFVGEFIKTIAG